MDFRQKRHVILFPAEFQQGASPVCKNLAKGATQIVQQLDLDDVVAHKDQVGLKLPQRKPLSLASFVTHEAPHCRPFPSRYPSPWFQVKMFASKPTRAFPIHSRNCRASFSRKMYPCWEQTIRIGRFRIFDSQYSIAREVAT